jgi:hypothetical protein
MSCPNPNGPLVIADGRLTEMRSLGGGVVIPSFTTAGQMIPADITDSAPPSPGFTSAGDIKPLGSTIV